MLSTILLFFFIADDYLGCSASNFNTPPVVGSSVTWVVYFLLNNLSLKTSVLPNCAVENSPEAILLLSEVIAIFTFPGTLTYTPPSGFFNFFAASVSNGGTVC